jgi:putative tryptophan/tyrosine transport system substrate-binding protein
MNRRGLLALVSGAAIGWPLAAHAQQKAMPVIGYLHFGSFGRFAYQVDAFRQGLSETGYVEGQNVSIEYRWAEGRFDQLPAFATELLDRKVDLIVALGPPSVRAAKNASSTIPIVFAVGDDPVKTGLVTSLARPGGNLTGISILAVDLTPKRLELLSELVPQAKVIALLINPNSADADRQTRDVQEAALTKGARLQLLKASNESEIDAAFAILAHQHANALVVGDDPFFTNQRTQIVGLAARHAVPATYPWREYTAAGGLISYGSNLAVVNRQVGVYAGKILRGAKPADLPVEQSTRLELVVNLKTAKALGITVPPILLERADEVIE